MTDPTFLAPLSALVEVSLSKHDRWKWFCLLEVVIGPCPGHSYDAPDRATAVQAATEHLASVHGIRPVGADHAELMRAVRKVANQWERMDECWGDCAAMDRLGDLLAVLAEEVRRAGE